MGLRILSVGSLVADGYSVANLAVNGIASETMAHGILLVAGAVLVPAVLVAERLLSPVKEPTAEVARQLAGFEANFLPGRS